MGVVGLRYRLEEYTEDILVTLMINLILQFAIMATHHFRPGFRRRSAKLFFEQFLFNPIAPDAIRFRRISRPWLFRAISRDCSVATEIVALG